MQQCGREEVCQRVDTQHATCYVYDCNERSGISMHDAEARLSRLRSNMQASLPLNIRSGPLTCMLSIGTSSCIDPVKHLL